MDPPKRPRSFTYFSHSQRVFPAFMYHSSFALNRLVSSQFKLPSCSYRPCRLHSFNIPAYHGRVLMSMTTSPTGSSLAEKSFSDSSPNGSTSQSHSINSSSSDQQDEDVSEDDEDDSSDESTNRPKRVMSVETRRKIARTLLGRPKSQDMRAKVSEKLKGRVPWNKGKKLSPETRARMSQARVGRTAWNKGRHLSQAHREAISKSASNNGRVISEETRKRMQMAHRRPGDAIVGDSSRAARQDVGSYPLVESSDINDFVTLRRELRVWSDQYVERNGKRPSIANIRRIAPVSIMRKFERYVAMRDRIRGLASDVYGSVDPQRIPVVPNQNLTDGPVNNNAQTTIHVTKHGNRRLVSKSKDHMRNARYNDGGSQLEGAIDDMWDKYDRPSSERQYTKSSALENSLIGTHEISLERKRHLSANDYRKIGRYRLMETMDINRYVTLRKELEKWSQSFKETHGRTPALSDAQASGKPYLYARFCEYLNMRDRMSGLVQEVYGTEVDDVEALNSINKEGKVILETLRSGNNTEDTDK